MSKRYGALAARWSFEAGWEAIDSRYDQLASISTLVGSVAGKSTELALIKKNLIKPHKKQQLEIILHNN